MRAAAVAAGAAIAALATAAPALAHGDRVAREELADAWTAPPVPLAVAGVLALLFVQGLVRLRRRGRADYAGLGRAALFGSGLAIGVLAVVSPLDAVGEEYLLSGHMLQHVLVADLAPALIVCAIRGPLTFFLLPAGVLAPLARMHPLRTGLRALLRPAVAVAVWSVVIGAWHVPALYEATLDDQVLHDLEHALFVLAGVLVWTQLIDPAGHRRLGRGGRIALAVYLLAAGQVLSELFLFAGRPLYPTYAAQDERLLGLTPLTDQHYAGAVMMVEQVLTLGVFLFVFFLAEDQRERSARAGTGVPGAEP
jgi:cytochrome c oxidase assembly factor CtaG